MNSQILYLILLLICTNCYSLENRNNFNIHPSEVIKITKQDPSQKSNVQAIKSSRDTNSEINKHQKENEIGISVFFVTIENEDFLGSPNNITHAGIAGYYNYAFNKHITSRIIVYEAKSDEESKRLTGINSRISGMETQLLLSTNTNKQGWKFYIGGVLFGEVWDMDSNTPSNQLPSEGTHSGIGVTYGLGYNYQSLAIDLSTSIHHNSAYDISNLQIAQSGGLSLSYRF